MSENFYIKILVENNSLGWKVDTNHLEHVLFCFLMLWCPFVSLKLSSSLVKLNLSNIVKGSQKNGLDERSPGQVPRRPEAFPGCNFAQTPARYPRRGDSMLSEPYRFCTQFCKWDWPSQNKARQGHFPPKVTSFRHRGHWDVNWSISLREIPHNITVSS